LQQGTAYPAFGLKLLVYNLSHPKGSHQMDNHPPMSLLLETERLILRPWTDGDVETYRELISERGGGIPSAEVVRGKIAAQHAHALEIGITLLAIHRRLSEGVIGYCGLTTGRATTEEPEIAFELLRRAGGQGYATEAAGVVIDAAIDTGRQRLWATIGAWNTASFRVVEKIGFRRDHSTVDEAGEVVWMTRRLRPL
jgi:RimJ/RimL family protein N-acetyltransferase